MKDGSARAVKKRKTVLEVDGRGEGLYEEHG